MKIFTSLTLALCSVAFIFSCNPQNEVPIPPPVPQPKPEPPYELQKEDIRIDSLTDSGFFVTVNQLLRVTITSARDSGLTYKWHLDGLQIALTKNLEYMIQTAGQYNLKLIVAHNDKSFEYEAKVEVGFGEVEPPVEGATAYITSILDYMPAVGQFTNKLPKYDAGDSQKEMNAKVLASIGNNNKGMISLGGFGGYVVAGFDHTIKNVEGKRDFRVVANAFYSAANPNEEAPDGGSCEPGVIMVAYDANGNGMPDHSEWYEIAGSAHEDPTKELWYQMAVDNKNEVELYRNYQITYHRPASEPESEEQWSTYIKWDDSRGQGGCKSKNMFHSQPYFPEWFAGDKLTFSGTCLPQNGIDESGEGSYYVLYKFRYGYADNELNASDDSAIDISWAVNSKGQRVNLPGVDFVKIYTGVNQENGWLGECSTEITSIEDLHILGVSIDTRR